MTSQVLPVAAVRSAAEARRRIDADRVFLVVVLVLSMAPVISLTHANVENAAQGSGAVQAVWAVLYLVLVMMIMRHPAGWLRVARAGWLIWVFVALALASITWSEEPSLTLRRAVALAFSSSIGVYFARRLSVKDFANALLFALTGIVVASAALAIAKPSLGLDHARGDAWRGLFGTKNELGRLATLATALWLLRFIAGGRRVRSMLWTIFCAWAVVESRSATGLAVLAILVALYLGLPALRAKGTAAVPAVCALVAGGIGVVAWYGALRSAILGALGRGTTLTGRTQIWQVVWPLVRRRLLFGWGYSAFWEGAKGTSLVVWTELGEPVVNSHNGLLDLAADLGIVGAGLLVWLILVTIVRAARYARTASGFGAVVPLATIVFLAVYDVTESSLALPNSLFWILLVWCSTKVALLMRGDAAG